MLDIDTLQQISQHCDIQSVICLILSSKYIFSQKDYFIQEHSFVQDFEKIYGKNSFLKTLFNSKKNVNLITNTQSQNVVENTMRIIMLENNFIKIKNPFSLHTIKNMIELFEDKIKTEYDLFQEHIKSTTSQFYVTIDYKSKWCETNINMYAIYKMLFLIRTECDFEIFEIENTTIGMVFDDVEKFKKVYFESLEYLIDMARKSYGSLIKVCITYIVFKFIQENIPYLILYKDDEKFKGLWNTYQNKIVEIKYDISGLYDMNKQFKKLCHLNLNKILRDIQTIY